ncbi:Phosphatidylglycerol phospholipase C [Escovopsis weberi]|uniref:Phosphatidylglycerol phospholipase C n=1 Tax=Escovopsis weberi TaxID=150374 RepID=A0A0N0RU21_ESCWE|nr:Phosphatidylglycerol phospholipase C [Escovopsis weberi]
MKRFVPRAAPWTFAVPVSVKRDDARRVCLPQAIAHRGYKAVWPENSMAAFKGAVDVGAHALETDLRLSADGVVVLSHDPSLKRCFGVDGLLSECKWEYLSSLRTIAEPAQPMARLVDLLEWLASDPDLDSIWLMLDLKRIVLGCWNATYVQAAFSVLPDYAVSHISRSAAYSRHFLPISNMGFSLVQWCLVGAGVRFLDDAKRHGAPTFTWTVNAEDWMDWLIRLNIPDAHHHHHHHHNHHHDRPSGAGTNSSNGAIWQPDDHRCKGVRLDGVITDDPKLFLQVRSRIVDELNRPLPIPAPADQTRRWPAVRMFGIFRARLHSLGQIVLGSVYARLQNLVMWYMGYGDYISDPRFFARFRPPHDDAASVGGAVGDVPSRSE